MQESGAAFPRGHRAYSAAFMTALILLVWNTRFRWLARVFDVYGLLRPGVLRAPGVTT